jgi:hypothetical protein
LVLAQPWFLRKSPIPLVLSIIRLTYCFSWFSYVFTYEGPNRALLGFYNAIELVCETGFALTAFSNLILNLILPEEIEDEETPELTANDVDEKKDDEEWARIRQGKNASNEENSVPKSEAIDEAGKA